MDKVRLLTKKDTYTFDYPQALEFTKQQIDNHWTADEIEVEKDLHDLKTNFTEAEIHGVITILKLFTLYEVRVGDEYWNGVISKLFQRPDIQRMASCFSFFETCIHAPFYNKLNEVLGLNTDEFHKSYKEDPILKERIKWIESQADIKNLENTSPYKILKSIGIFSMIEGAILYSSFAFLKHFQAEGKNKLVNVTAGINFSVQDECLVPESEVLTPNGWKRIDQINIQTDKVAQFNPETKEVTFVYPTRVVKSKTEKLYHFSNEKNGKISQLVTPNHRMPVRSDWKNEIEFKLAKDIKYHPKNFIPVSGYVKGLKKVLTPFEKLLIATQADGNVSNRYTGEKVGTIPFLFSFSKERKIERILTVFQETGFSWDELTPKKEKGNRKKQRVFKINVPISILNDVNPKNFSWVNMENISDSWCSEFIQELKHWDSCTYEKSSTFYYSSVSPDCVDTVQGICALCGLHTTRYVQVDDRSESFSDCHRLHIFSKTEKRGGTIKKEEIKYNGEVYCLTVPTGAFIMRHDNCVSVTGNCLHAEAGAWLFRTLLSEIEESGDTNINKQRLFNSLVDAAEKVYEHECHIIDMLFEKGPIKGITATQLKNFVQSRLDLCLQNLGIEKYFKPSYNPIDKWFYKNVGMTQLHDFFYKQGSAYTRDWSETKFVW